MIFSQVSRGCSCCTKWSKYFVCPFVSAQVQSLGCVNLQGFAMASCGQQWHKLHCHHHLLLPWKGQSWRWVWLRYQKPIISYLFSHPGNSFILQNWKWPNHISKDQLTTQNPYFLPRLLLIPVHGLPCFISCSTRFPSLLVCLSLNQHCMSLTLTDVFIVM